MAKSVKKQPAAPAFKIVGIIPGPVHFKGRNIDLSKLNDQELGKLREQGMPYVQPK